MYVCSVMGLSDLLRMDQTAALPLGVVMVVEGSICPSKNRCVKRIFLVGATALIFTQDGRAV